jgi:hypothetical protein
MLNFDFNGSVMAEAVSALPVISKYGICGGKSRTGTSFIPNTLLLPCQYHITNAPYSSSS